MGWGKSNGLKLHIKNITDTYANIATLKLCEDIVNKKFKYSQMKNRVIWRNYSNQIPHLRINSFRWIHLCISTMFSLIDCH